MEPHNANGEDHLHNEEQPEDLTLRERPLDLEAVRTKLQSVSGKQYWRTLEELAADPHFNELLHREFPRHASEWDDAVDRRDFLKLMAASLAFAGLAGCKSNEQPNFAPYVRQPDGVVLGKPLYFATAMPMGADAVGILVESHEGRPTKIEGNPDHPSSLGATDAITQASILDLYDPDRARTTTFADEIRTWAAFLDFAQAQAAENKATNGAGFRILTGTITSPTLIDQIQYLLKLYPQAKWHQWEPGSGDGAYDGAKLAFGRYVNTVYRPDKADVIVALDSDFMFRGPGHIRYQKDFYRRRKLDKAAENDAGSVQMNRLYAAEPTPTVTGSNADHRLPLRPAEIEHVARALAAKLGLGGSDVAPASAEKWLDAVVKDLQRSRGKSLVIAGEYQPAEVHALAHAINASLGNVGNTLYYTEAVEGQPTNRLESLRELCADLDAGKVSTLVIIDVNPVYDAPHDFDFVSKISPKKVGHTVRVSTHFDETAGYCTWHVAESHYLETWSDARAFDGTVSVIQPLIAPLYRTRSARDVLAAFSDKPGGTDFDAVRERLRPNAGNSSVSNAAEAFENYWRKTLNDGVVANSAYPPINVTAKLDVAGLPPVKEGPAGGVEFIFRPDPFIHDGRYANNGWLQELPKPITKTTWDNAAMMSPNTSWNYEIKQVVAARGGEHGQIVTPVIDVALSNSKVSAAAWILPGQADNVILMPLGYGRQNAGFTGSNKGFNAYVVRTSDALWTAYNGKISKTGQEYPIGCTQYHFNIEGRRILITGTLEEYKQNPNFANEEPDRPPKSDTLYKEFSYPGYAWGMAIDLNSCNGCSACVAACNAENNIPIVGKDQVLRAREMHWIRIDRYYTVETPTNDPRTDHALANPPTFFQPVPCMQCENAPCEQVCPVGATVHSAEGLNDMVYNRCIGTRYCSNNCPYKVRRFNFLRFQDWETPQYKLMRNPEVTVRSRGVMEKCTYCVQRINNARVAAEKENRPIRDGEIVTACQAACPSEAIIFGNANDPNTRVAKLKAQQRNYTILGELNSRPRTTYLAAVRNPDPELEKS